MENESSCIEGGSPTNTVFEVYHYLLTKPYPDQELPLPASSCIAHNSSCMRLSVPNGEAERCMPGDHGFQQVWGMAVFMMQNNGNAHEVVWEAEADVRRRAEESKGTVSPAD